MNIQYKKYLSAFFFLGIFTLIPSLAFAGIYIVSGDGSEVGRENCTVVMDDGRIYEGTAVYDFGGMSPESAARLCLGYLPPGIITSTDGGTYGQVGSVQIFEHTVGDIPSLYNSISYPLSVPANLTLNTNILIAESTLGSLGFFKRAPDGIFDRMSAEAVKSFQRSVALPATGTIDKLTWLLLLTR